ncbi:MAG: Lhr family helicase [Acidimicrobiales bacterium]
MSVVQDVVGDFHPAVRAWFEERFADGPTPAQAQGWPLISAGLDTLIAAPTGSGKTLAAFLVCIDQLYRATDAGTDVTGQCQVVYVSPLKALAVDIQHNLRAPLAEIAQVATAMGLNPPDLRVEVRNGDTPASARAMMIRRPPNFLVTTPESLYLLVTAERSRAILSSVTTVIVDEIHAVARDKRGSHLSLTLERLDHLCPGHPVRIGLSATQRPIRTVARLLVGAGPDRSDATGQPLCAVVDVGHRRALDLAIELPGAELEAVASQEQLDDVLARIAELVNQHRTSIIFVNTRRMAERIAHRLAEALGEDVVASHHGSLSKERRLKVEDRLRSGALRALVATASLELGIDIGPVDLVCQIASPRSMATFLQRVGRSGHSRGATPKGRLYPMTRDELVECAALLAGVRAGQLDAIHPPVAPLDILAQHIVAETSARRWNEHELYDLVRRAAPYADLARDDFDEVIELVCEGIQTGRGQRAAHVHRDRINNEVQGRRGARLAALTSGGAIPETGDYRVVAEPDDVLVGTVNEDWAIESMAGDVFLLGSTSWRIGRVEPGTVRVADAQGAPPSVPFWLGEAPARTHELSREVSDLRAGVAARLGGSDASRSEARRWVEGHCGVGPEVSEQVVGYLAVGHTALGGLPTFEHLMIERFFDDTGGMQLVVHSPYGGRINRAFGLALRKRFCVSFDFELQAAASDDAVLLSLGPQHSFALDSVPDFLASKTVESVLRQACLFSPMFTARWRWNLNRSLVVLRFRSGRKNPPPIQRMEADDIMAAVFPALAACQENATGPIHLPDHPLVRQTMYDCLHEAMDIDGLVDLVRAIEDGSVKITCRDTTEPSPLAHEILNGRPYTFLDDAPLEERRSRAVSLRRGLPLDGRDLSTLDPDAISRVRLEAEPDIRSPDELYDLLMALVACRPRRECQEAFDLLAAAGRAALVTVGGEPMWYSTELADSVGALHPSAYFGSHPQAPSAPPPDCDDVAAVALRGHLDTLGPVQAESLAQVLNLQHSTVAIALGRLEQEGFVLRGRFDPELDAEQWCSRRLLARIHAYTQHRLRREIEPVSARDLMRFLLRWQRVTDDTRRQGRAGVSQVIEQLQGFEVPVAAWESEILSARIQDYKSNWLDELCSSGEVGWTRLGLRQSTTVAPRGTNDNDEQLTPSAERSRNGTVTSRATPITLTQRMNLGWLIQAARGDGRPIEPQAGATRDVLDALAQHGALFHADIGLAAGRMPSEVDGALWDAVSRGLVTADGFAAVRSLLAGRRRDALSRGYRHGVRGHRRSALRQGAQSRPLGQGRWYLLPAGQCADDTDALAEAVAEQLLARWGIVFKDLLARETLDLAWREVLWALRRMEARGTVRGGRFVTGFSGEQYALPEAVAELRAIRRTPRTGQMVRLSGADPLNLIGILTPGPRIPAVLTNRIAYCDGAPIESPDQPPARRRVRTAV